MAKKIIAKCDVSGHLRSGYFKLTLSDEEYKEFSESTKEDKETWIKDCGTFRLDDYEVYDYDIWSIEEDGD